MRRFTEILFVVVLIVIAYETFKPQAPFPPAHASQVSAPIVSLLQLAH